MGPALLVIDMQEHFTSMTHECLPSILQLTPHFKAHDILRMFKHELTPP